MEAEGADVVGVAVVVAGRRARHPVRVAKQHPRADQHRELSSQEGRNFRRRAIARSSVLLVSTRRQELLPRRWPRSRLHRFALLRHVTRRRRRLRL